MLDVESGCATLYVDATEDAPRSRRPVRWMRRGGAGRAGRTRSGTLSVEERPKRDGEGRWCSGVSLVQPAGAGNMQRGGRIDRPRFGDDLALVRRELRKAGELQRYAGGAVSGVVRVMLMGATTLDVSRRAPRRACLGRRCQKRGNALRRQREEGGQDENTRTWTAKLAEHAGHYRKLVNVNLAVTTRRR